MYPILEKRLLAEGIWLMKVLAPRVARSARPGQFIIVRADEHGERIPLTISDFDAEEGSVTIVTQAIKPYKQMRIPQPDFVLCCNNICNCMTKWYENIARMCNIPLIMVDIPYNNTVEVSDSAVKYVRAQFDNAIHELEKLTGKKFDEKKFELACKHANRTAQNWLKVCDFLQYKPAPMSGFDLFNHMADVVTARGKEAAADAFELLSKDLQKNIEEGPSCLLYTSPSPRD